MHSRGNSRRTKDLSKRRRQSANKASPTQSKDAAQKEIFRSERRVETPLAWLKTKTSKPLPCDGTEKAIEHVRSYAVTEMMARLFHEKTGDVLRCCWLTCPVFSVCDHKRWGQQPSDRDLSESMMIDMSSTIGARRGPFSDKEREFLEQMLELFETDDTFAPSTKQANWIQSLYLRWLDRH